MDDFVLNVRQLASYPRKTTAGPADAVLLQAGGLGGQYYWTTPTGLLKAGALSSDPIAFQNVTIADLTAGWLHFSGVGAIDAPGGFSFTSGSHPVLTMDPDGIALCNTVMVGRNPISPMEVATARYVTDNTVWTWNGRRGNVQLTLFDLVEAGGLAANSPHLTGTPTVPDIRDERQADGQIANTDFVHRAVNGGIQHFLDCHPLVFSFNGRAGDVILNDRDITHALKATGARGRSRTPPPFDVSDRIATTEFVDWSVAGFQAKLDNLEQSVIDKIDLSSYATLAQVEASFAPLASPQFTGFPSGPTASFGSSTGQFATTAFVQAAITASTVGVASFNTRTGAVTLAGSDISGAGGALLASPAFTGTPTAPTATPGTNTGQIANCAWVLNEIAVMSGGVTTFNGRSGAVTLQLVDITGAGGAPLVSPALTGNPTAPTLAQTDNSTSLATTAFVHNVVSAISAGVTTFNGRSGTVTLNTSDISAAGGAGLNSPAFTGIPTAPNPATGNNSTEIATTQWVNNAIAGAAVTSWNGRTGAVTLQAADLTAVGGALLSSPTFTGTPTAPTAPAGTNTTQIATTAFVEAAMTTATAGVASFNGRTGAVTLAIGDITTAGGAPLNNAGLTGNPTAVTQAAGTNNTTLATTAFVQAAIAAYQQIGVTAFNNRTGAVTLTAADVSGVGGALLAGPAFTGVPTAPTAAAGTSTTQLATTAFVANALSQAGVVTTFNGRAGAVTLTAADLNTAGGVLYSTGQSLTPTQQQQAQANIGLSGAMPTVQRFTSGTGTYTPAAGVKWIRVIMVGGGGGGGGGNAGAAGGTTSFGGWTANGGPGGNAQASPSVVQGGHGGANGAGTLVVRVDGGGGQPAWGSSATSGGFGPGGLTHFGGNSAAGATITYPPAAGSGAGGNSNYSGTISGTGGGAGEYVEFLVSAPSSTAYTVGAGGAAGGTAPSPGGGGQIIVEEHY